MPDYMPRKDGQLLMWATNFSTYLAEHGAEFGLSPEQIEEISSGVGTLETTLGRHTEAAAAAQASRQVKIQTRGRVEGAIRTLVRQLQARPSLSNAQRESMGITVAGNGKAASNSHLPTYPIATVDTAQRFRHRITYFDASNISRKARPAHTFGCEIWVCITEPGHERPLDDQAYRNLGLSVTSPFLAEYSGEEAGKTAHYRLRWIGSDGKKGTWGPAVAATIVG